MNREKNLISSLYSWLDCHKYITEIIIVDWSSSIPLIEQKEISDLVLENKVKLLRVDNEQNFSLPMSYNLAYDYISANNKIMLKIDSDYFLTSNKWLDCILFSKQNELRNYFISGKWMFGESLTGFLLCNKKHFVYYNENFSGWGYDDDDLYNTMKKDHVNLHQIIFFDIKNYIEHIYHTDLDRTVNHEDKDKDSSRLKNEYIATISNTRRFSKYETIYSYNNYIKFERIKNV